MSAIELLDQIQVIFFFFFARLVSHETWNYRDKKSRFLDL